MRRVDEYGCSRNAQQFVCAFAYLTREAAAHVWEIHRDNCRGGSAVIAEDQRLRQQRLVRTLRARGARRPAAHRQPEWWRDVDSRDARFNHAVTGIGRSPTA